MGGDGLFPGAAGFVMIAREQASWCHHGHKGAPGGLLCRQPSFSPPRACPRQPPPGLGAGQAADHAGSGGSLGHAARQEAINQP